MKMEGKRVLVTGSGTGVGKGVALEFAEEGATVAVHYSSSAAGAEDTIKQITDGGRKAKAFKADMNDLGAIKNLATDAIDYLGGLDILINNSGITLTCPFEDVTPEKYDEIYNVNIRAMFFLTQYCVPTMESQGRGVVLNISSVHAYTGLAEHSVYAGTKGAIVSYTRALGHELNDKGIRVNCIAPGWVFIEKHEAALPPGFDMEAAKALMPSKFIATPRQVGRLALFMASEEADYMVGHTVLFDGGQVGIQPLAKEITKLFNDCLPPKK